MALSAHRYFQRARHGSVTLHPVTPERLAELGAFGRAVGHDLLLITVDTVRADRLGCYGYPNAVTPNIDRLAAHGVQFLQAIAPAPLTLPSHSTILTGLDVPSHGVRDNGTFRLDADQLTLAEILAGQGYDTAAFVGAYVLDSRYGLDQGFGTYDDHVDPPGTGAPSGHFNERSADAVTRAAIRWLEQRGAGQGTEGKAGRPFFMWVHYFDAHAPYQPPVEHGRRAASAYDGEIAFVDQQIGRLLKHLETPPLVILAADHGEGLGEHGEETHSRLIYDSTMRVPLIISSPRLFKQPVTVHERVVSLADIFPTALDLLGVRLDRPIDGEGLLTSSPDVERAIYVETMAPLLNNGWASLHGLRRVGDKVILAPRPELYDLAVDPGERANIFGDGQGAAAELTNQLRERLEEWDDPAQVQALAATLDPEQVRRLAALGYVSQSMARPRPEGDGKQGNNLERLDPKDALPLWQDTMRAQETSNRGEHEQAAAQIEEVLAGNAGDAQAWDVASLIHKRRDLWEKAEDCLTKSIELQATADRYVRLAQLKLRRGAVEEADAALEQAAELDPQHGELHITRGDRLAMNGRFEEARRSFERALEVDPVRVGALAQQKLRAVDERLGGR